MTKLETSSIHCTVTAQLGPAASRLGWDQGTRSQGSPASVASARLRWPSARPPSGAFFWSSPTCRLPSGPAWALMSKVSLLPHPKPDKLSEGSCAAPQSPHLSHLYLQLLTSLLMGVPCSFCSSPASLLSMCPLISVRSPSGPRPALSCTFFARRSFCKSRCPASERGPASRRWLLVPAVPTGSPLASLFTAWAPRAHGSSRGSCLMLSWGGSGTTCPFTCSRCPATRLLCSGFWVSAKLSGGSQGPSPLPKKVSVCWAEAGETLPRGFGVPGWAEGSWALGEGNCEEGLFGSWGLDGGGVGWTGPSAGPAGEAPCGTGGRGGP